MNKEQVKTLLKYARSSIEARFENKDFEPKEVPKELTIKRGVFVTLTINKTLRGCIGRVNPTPLWKGVIKAARSSAFSDPRFTPLSKEEYKQTNIEISILSKPYKTTLKQIKKGDGVIISKSHNNALFLPQVWEQLPDKKEFIQQLSLKAGLESIEEAKFEKFGVEAWKELSPNGDVTLTKPVNP